VPRGYSEARVVLFNDTGVTVDVAVHVDGKPVFWGAAATPQREPGMSFDLPLRVRRGSHRLTVLVASRRQEVVFEATQDTTIEIRLREKDISVVVLDKRRIYM
jgi:hypothetical protein